MSAINQDKNALAAHAAADEGIAELLPALASGGRTGGNVRQAADAMDDRRAKGP